ncbi:MAG: histidinol-phosphatase [Frankiales bacterium]|nr:histidinol-phosphatase [Frankiales bacterium]
MAPYPPRVSFADDLELALSLADLADQITRDRFRALDLRVETKPDLTPVSDADTAVEAALRSALAEHRAADSVLGEELGGTSTADGRQWIIDPIDGTKNFVRGQPVWATLIALRVDGVGVVGVVSAPALNRRWWAARGEGAWVAEGGERPRRLAVSAVGSLSDAYLSYSSLSGWGVARERLLALTETVWRTRAFGDFWSYCLVAEGAVDLAAEPEVSLWDLAALEVVVTEAGGRFTGLNGVQGAGHGNALASNGLLHDAALAALGV